ncbi:MAG: AfsR/SARP family transcriptional regulator [candidate division WOR-3 bacterium]
MSKREVDLDRTMESLNKGLHLLSCGPEHPEFIGFLNQIRKEDPLAFQLLSVARLVSQFKSDEAIEKARGLFPKVSGNSALSLFLNNRLAMAHCQLGNLKLSEDYAEKAIEISKNSKIPTNAYMNLFEIMLRRRDHYRLRDEIRKFLSSLKSDEIPLPDGEWREHARLRLKHWAEYLLAYVGTLDGSLKSAGEKLRSILNDKTSVGNTDTPHVLEVYALCLRFSGRLEEAWKHYQSSLNLCLENRMARAAFPCARLIELSMLGEFQAPPEETIKACKALSEKGGQANVAAAIEMEGLWEKDWKKLLVAAEKYNLASYPVETFTAGLLAAFGGFKDESEAFPKALNFLKSLGYIYDGFRQDPLLGDFLKKTEPFLNKNQHKPRIRAYVIGELRVWVDGNEISTTAWGERKALLALVYLLLQEKHRIPSDHLAYLLRAKNDSNEKQKNRLYRIISLLRKEHLRDSRLLVKTRDFYQLEDVWTDLGELENLIRLAEATRDPAEREEFLTRARELAKRELLPEFPYDRHIDEYREYYKRLRRKLFGEDQF